MTHTTDSSAFLLYLNGIKLPALNVTVDCADGGSASASAQIPWSPILEGLGEEDLLQAAIFYLDTVYYEKPTYCLLFEGRMVGYSYSNSPSGESMNLSFESNLMALNDLSINFIGSKSGTKSTANKDYPNQLDVKTTASKLLTTKLSGRSIQRPFDIVENIIYAVTGSYRDTDSYVDKIDGTLESKKKQLKSIFEKEVSRLISANLPAGKREEDLSPKELSDLQNLVSKKFAVRVSDDSGSAIAVDRYYREGQKPIETIDEYIRERINKEAKDKASNYRDVIMSGFFARHFRLIRFKEHWLPSPYLEGFQSDDSHESSLGNGVFPLLKSKGAKKYFKALVKRTGEKMGAQGRALMLIKSLYSMMFYKVQEVLAPPAYVSSKYSIPEASLRSIVGEIRENIDDYYGVNYDTPHSRATSKGGHVSIGSFMTCPDAPYAVPPSCNVIFPSMRLGYTMSNSTNTAPTRVYFNRKSSFGKLDLQSKAKGYNYDATRVGYPSVAAGLAQKAAGSSSKDLETLVFPEEFYRGPRISINTVHPSYSSLQKFANSARFSEGSDRGNIPVGVFELDSENSNEALSAVEASNSKGISSYGLYYLLAEKEYEQMKSQTRSASVSTVFNPYLVVGMSCALLSGDDSGMHYYGKVVSVNHTINNKGAATSTVTISSVRSIKDDLSNVINSGAITDITPADPIEEIRTLLQTNSGAEEYYRVLLKSGEKLSTTIDSSEIVAIESKLRTLNTSLDELKNLKDKIDKGDETYTVFGAVPEISYTLIQLDGLISDLTSGAVKPGNPTIGPSRTIQQLVAAEISNIEKFKKRYDDLNTEISDLESKISVVNAEYDKATEKSMGTRYACSFDPKQFLGWKNTGRPSYINILDTDPNSYFREQESADDIVWGVPANRPLVPLAETKDYFTDTRRALQYCARPVCTLEDYIDFYNIAGRGDTGIDLRGRGRGVRGGVMTDSSGARYYNYIRSFIGGPGVQPGSTVAGREQSNISRVSSNVKVEDTTTVTKLYYMDYAGSSREYSSLAPGKVATLDDLPDSRKDWQSLLIDYVRLIEQTASKRDG